MAAPGLIDNAFGTESREIIVSNAPPIEPLPLVTFFVQKDADRLS